MPVGTTKVAMFETSTQDNILESERTVLIQLAGAWLNDGKRLCQLDLSAFKLGLLLSREVPQEISGVFSHVLVSIRQSFPQ
jgi:hypothetical protein